MNHLEATDVVWSVWFPLRAARRSFVVSATAGLYRIREPGADVWDYIGQTGDSLRRRLGMLAGVFGDEMPYRDPHTAGPALWAARQLTRIDVEASVAIVDAPMPVRLGLECVTIAEHRWRTGRSPRWNFGRMPVGYRMSSANNRRLTQAGRRYRGGPLFEDDASHATGLAPVAVATDDPADLSWGHLSWSQWTDLRTARRDATGHVGLYRMTRASAEVPLTYVGQGAISQRLAQHVTKARDPLHRQSFLFAGEDLHCSWVGGDWLSHQRLELENDLIANHMLRHGVPPLAQFLG